MPLERYICPDKEQIAVKDCLQHCRMGERCLTLPTLHLIGREREWNGVASTTQLIDGTMYLYLKLRRPYAVDPDDRMFALYGTIHHKDLEQAGRLLGLPAEIPLSVDRDIFDLIEQGDNGELILTDYKLWGSFKVAKALGIIESGKRPDPSGALYKTSGKWGKEGSAKMIPNFVVDPSKADNHDATLQLNNYRVKLEQIGIHITRMQVQATVRDGNTYTAKDRGVTRNSYRILIQLINNQQVLDYFAFKQDCITRALATDSWGMPCNPVECWNDSRCREYCEVKGYCPKGVLL